MAVSHVFSNAVPDATGTMTVWFGATTATVAASDVVKPGDWNSAHNQVVTLSGNTVGVGIVTGTNIVFAGTNNVTLSGVQGANAGTIHISAAAGGGGGSVNVSAGTTSNNLTNFVFADSNGVSFGLNGSTITATVATNYLTTARASTDAIGLATAQSNVTWTANSAGLSLDARGYAGTGTTIGATNLSASATLNSNGLQLSLSAAAGGGGADGGNTIIAGTRTAGSNSAVLFDNSNGVTFGLNAVGGTVLTASVRTDYASSNHAHTENIGTATAQTNVTWTVNSNGLSLNAAGYAGTGFTSTTTAGTAIVATNATNGLSLAFPTIVTNALTSQSNQNITAANGGFAFQTLSFSNLNGVSFGTSAGSAITASVQTSYRASNDAIGTNTAQSNVTWTANSAGLSLDARGYAGTGTTFNGANLSGSMTVNSNGVQLSMSAAAPGGGGLTQGTFYAQSNTTQSSTGTIALSSLNFAGAGIASVGITNGSVVISVPAGGGVGDGGVFLAADTRTAGTNSTVLFSNANGVSFGLDAVNGSIMTASVNAGGGGGIVAGVSNLGNTAGSTGTVSTGNFVLVGSNGITLSQSTGAAGSAATITINGAPPVSFFEPFLWNSNNAANAQASQSTSYFHPFSAPLLSASFLRLFPLITTNSTSFGTTANTTFSMSRVSTVNAVVYSQGTGASSQSLQSVASGSAGFTQQWSLQAGTAGSQYTVTINVSYPITGGTSNYSTSYQTSQTRFDISTQSITLFTGSVWIDVPFAASLSGGQYWLGFGMSTSTGTNGTAAFSAAGFGINGFYAAAEGLAQNAFGVAANNTHHFLPGMGSFSTAGGGTTASLPISAVTRAANRHYFQMRMTG